MKILRGNQIDVFKQKFLKLDRQKRNYVAQNIRFGKDGTISIKNYSRVVEVMRLNENDIDDNMGLLS